MSKPLAVDFAQQGDKYVLKTLSTGAHVGVTYSEMDCQKFYERMLADVGVKKNLTGSNAWFRFMDWIGTPEECRKRFGLIPVGATLFIWEETGAPARYKDGRGNASHIGVYTGRNGGAIHSSQSRGGVAYSTFKGKTIKGGWNRVGLTSLLSYGEKVDNMILGTPTDITLAAAAQTITSEERAARVTGGKLNVRVSPGGQVVTRLENGEQVEIIADHGDWAEVRYHRTGYVMKKYLEEA